ncbi:STAS/SEC14 domain-containing protein [Oceaniglobus roseus]|uniref:STAS/SEC14 domain-containing protein n=1 Tax=Oceaniglobus roseus TaxID=1737570 RepID=UPI000C7EB00E|nr:STAS/SEC14 domain-containing protein [Kandeliimicrobium roseum]
MIEVTPSPTEGTLEIRYSGTISEEDYTRALIPALDAAMAEHPRLRLLVRMESGFGDFTLGALFEDSRFGLKHWRGFDRVAIVADPGGMTRAIRAFSVFFPCPVMVFPLAGEDDARRWLSESLGSIHQTDLGEGMLHVQLLGKLDAAVYAAEEEDLNAFIRAHDRFRLLLDLRQFDGWQGLGALGERLRLVRDHRMLVDKLAIVRSGAVAKMAERLASTFFNAEVKHFDNEEFEDARAWLAAD